MRDLRRLLVALGLFVLASGPSWSQPTSFARADGPREWDLPRDHRAHPEHALEWWYLTGDLRTEEGRRFGYQATFFRKGLAPPGESARSSPFAARELVLWHGSITDVEAREFSADAAISRVAAGWASASSDSLEVQVGIHSLRASADEQWQLRAGVEGWRLELDYELDRSPVLHGASPGWSRKGAELGNSSYYVSRVQLTTRGRLVAPDGREHFVSGKSWFDQEFGSGQLGETQVGWDWFSANLSDGSALMVYQLRESGGAASPESSGSWVRADGTVEHLRREDFEVEVRRTWRSPASGAEYPVAWTLRVPSEELRLELQAVMPEQERGADRSGGVIYWEGLVDFAGDRAGKPVRGSGYVELVGYAAAFELMR